MMIVLGITAVLIVLLIIILIVLKKRKKCSSCSPKEVQTSKEPVKPQPELKTAEKPIVNAEPAAVNSQITAAAIVAPPAEPHAKETVPPSPVKSNSCSLPQDSILRRHYFTHLCTMTEALAPPRPTDSILCRHYDTMIVAKIAQCLNDKNAMEQLICDYEKLSV